MNSFLCVSVSAWLVQDKGSGGMEVRVKPAAWGTATPVTSCPGHSSVTSVTPKYPFPSFARKLLITKTLTLWVQKTASDSRWPPNPLPRLLDSP